MTDQKIINKNNYLKYNPGGSRYLLPVVCIGFYLLISCFTRIALAGQAWHAGQIQWLEWPRILLLGLGSDLATSLYMATPFMLYLLVLPRRLYHTRFHRVLAWCLVFVAFFSFAYLAAVEYFFFDEFNARFNFVAVEYLIYPHEVFVNIWQSYPVGTALVISALVALLVTWRMRHTIHGALLAETRFRQRLLPALLVLAALLAVFRWVDNETVHTRQNRIADELAGNGIHSFFSAALNSHLDYERYYLTLPQNEVTTRARRLVEQPNTRFIAGAENPIARHVISSAPPNRLHVIVVLEESLGAEFVGVYGAKPGLTPNIDRLAGRSLLFTNAYATGTRTVRGMEAVTASFPPVPAESIVKRAHNENLFNWSTVMREQGYSPTFIYGGYGTFDNMNHFFGSNGYRVIDRTDMDTPRFSNIWGVSDEDLFRNALVEFDRQHGRGEHIFSVIMTTSNHKPFTFPQGVPGVKPEGGGREAGVRYADHALGRFVEALERKPYFGDTLLVIIADHGARVYGRENIPLPTYAIPWLVYSPKYVPARHIDIPVSQIDVAPTVLGLLRFSYDSAFFGRDALAGGNGNIPLNHNRDIALYRNGVLNQLGFRKSSGTLAYDPGTRRQTALPDDAGAQHDTASMFQLAYTLFTERRYHAR